MRYSAVEIVSFTDENGNVFPVRELREMESATTIVTIDRLGDSSFDEIASRKEIYGNGAEGEAYRIHEANIAEIVESNFEYSNIKKVKVPV